MLKINLNGQWNLKSLSPEGEEGLYKATVPGCVLAEMIKAPENKEYSDIFYRDNADYYLKYERYCWVYSKTFEIAQTDEVATLEFERLDTYCDIYLNNKHLAYCDNGNMAHRFDVTSFVKPGENTISIHFYSPISMTDGKKKREGAFTTERLYTRRMQCTYGWDWVMRFVTCGIGDARLCLDKKRMKASSAYVYTVETDEESATLGIDVDIKNHQLGGYLEAELLDASGKRVFGTKKYCQEDFVRLFADVVNPKLWYPAGYGEQYLYTLKIYTDGELDYETPVGIRTIKIMQLPDEVGSENYNKCIELKKTPFSMEYDQNESFSGFILKVNGIKIMCKGANWVPCEPFNQGSTDKKITRILERASECGVNMVRVWGGGAFETSHFYDECSRLGILVTQDFLMACGTYPEDESWFINQLQKEAQYAVHHLRNKPCLVWWSGDNENAVNGCDTDTNYHGRAAAYKAIAPVLYQKDFMRRFLPSSPFGGKKYASNTVGTTHNTQYLSYFFEYLEKDDLSDYKDVFNMHSARFIAEDTVFGAIKQDSLQRFMTPDDIFGSNDDMWNYHTKSNPALNRELFDYMDMFTEKILGKYTDGADRYFKLKYMQYEWIRNSIERTRRDKWFSSGIIYWMLNDCWPAASGWAIIDYYVQPKAGFYSFKRGAKPVMISVDLKDGKYRIHLCNDKLCAESFSLRVMAINQRGEIQKTLLEKEVSSRYNSSVVVAAFGEDQIPQSSFVVAQICNGNDIVDRAFYKKGILDIKNADGKLECTFGKNTVSLKANTYVHAVELECNGKVSDNYFSMLPGEEVEISYESDSKPQITAYSF